VAISREHHALLSLAVGLNESALKGHRRHARAGTPLGEFWVLELLACDCAYDRQHAFLLVSVPVSVEGAGSVPPPQTVAVK
jgi:hypothetical protein